MRQAGEMSRARQRGGLWRTPLSALGRSAPFAIIAYVLVLAALRLSVSDFLSLEEARLVGRVDLRWDYGLDHGPLAHWLTRVVLELSNWDWALSVAAVGYGGLCVYHLSLWALAARLAEPRTAALAVGASALSIPVLWSAPTALPQGGVALGAAGLLLWSAHRAVTMEGRGAWSAFALFGLAASACLLSSFAAAALSLALIGTMLTDATARARLLRPAAIGAVAVFALLTGPAVVGVALASEQAARQVGWIASVDRPAASAERLDFWLSAALSLSASVALGLLVWATARWIDRDRPARVPVVGPVHVSFLHALGWTTLAALGLAALLRGGGGGPAVSVAALAPAAAALPVWLAGRWPLRRSAGPVLAFAATLYVAALPAFWGATTLAPHRYATPYDHLAGLIARSVDSPAPIYATDPADGANAMVALRWPGAASPTAPPLDDTAIVLWRGRGAAPDGLGPSGFGPAAAVVTVALRVRNGSAETLLYSFQVFERL